MNQRDAAVKQQTEKIRRTIHELRSFEEIRWQLSKVSQLDMQKGICDMIIAEIARFPVEKMDKLNSCAYLLVMWRLNVVLKTHARKSAKCGTLNSALSQFLILMEFIEAEQQMKRELYSIV
jgi:hypothetical protein